MIEETVRVPKGARWFKYAMPQDADRVNRLVRHGFQIADSHVDPGGSGWIMLVERML
jgi:hypothetical protein